MKTVSGFILFALALAMTGCATRPDAARPAPPVANPAIPVLTSLAGTSWQVSVLGGQALSLPPPDWDTLSLAFSADGKSVVGHAGVNRFGGRCALSKTQLVLGPLARTRRAGPPELMELERRYTHALSQVVGWRKSGANIVLLDRQAAELATLTREPVR